LQFKDVATEKQSLSCDWMKGKAWIKLNWVCHSFKGRLNWAYFHKFHTKEIANKSVEVFLAYIIFWRAATCNAKLGHGTQSVCRSQSASQDSQGLVHTFPVRLKERKILYNVCVLSYIVCIHLPHSTEPESIHT